MKFLSSSASSTITVTSTAATTTSSFDGNNVNSSKSATAGCIAGVFRRLLCLNSLPTYPSDDHFKETELLEENTYTSSSSVDFDIKAAEVKIVEGGGGGGGSATPNIVARLMGLESLPQIDRDLLLTNEQKNSAAISRSRSMNYVDTVLKELQYSKQGKQRRAKSFRETPTFLHLDEDENFLILSFENNNGAENMKFPTKGKIKSSPAEKTKTKTKNTRREQTNSSTGGGKNKENQETRNGSDEEEYYFTKRFGATKDSSDNILRNYSNRNSKPAIHGHHERDRRSNRRTRINKSKDEILPVKKSGTESSARDDDDSENSSPNSVLDNTMDFPCDPEDDNTISAGGGVPRLRNSKTRRTLTEELENYRKLNLLGNGQNLIRNIAFKSKTGEAAGKCVQLRRNYDQIRYVEIIRMAEKETVESSWVRSKIQNLEDYNEEESIIISAELEFKILDQLVNELILDLEIF